MNQAHYQPTTNRSPIERAYAEGYLLTSIAAFAGSVILTRLFLELTGYPQVGNSVLHIAHALWGGLLLIGGILVPLILSNRWALTLSALLSGLGVGLFIDEVGKFITQTNDYFYPPAAPLIYAFFLLLVLLFLFVRLINKSDPRTEMYHALGDLRELIDNNLDPLELENLLARLEIARRSEHPHIAGLSQVISTYLQETGIPLVPAKPGPAKRFSGWLAHWGQRLGRNRHRWLIIACLAAISASAVITVVALLYIAISPVATVQDLLEMFMTEAEIESVGGGFWFILRIILQILVGGITLLSGIFFLQRKDQLGVLTALAGLLISLTGVLLLTFYLNQFSAVTTALLQFAILLLVIAYQRWYLAAPTGEPARHRG